MAQSPSSKGFLFDVRVLELADQKGEFLGKIMAGVGADVVKVEPPNGSPTRAIGPFYHDEEGPERSLHFWHYNHGKKSLTLDVSKEQGQEVLRQLVPKFDVLIETFRPGYMDSIGLGYKDLAEINPRLVMISVSPFGQTGPWRDRKSSDLVSLALGGVMMNCGYDRTPQGEYDTPPVAPQMWHASHITCNQAYIAVVGALLFREQTGKGQYIDAPMHQAISANTEMDVPTWVYNRVPTFRQTGRHAATRPTTPSQAVAKDGRFVHTSAGIGRGTEHIVEMLEENGAAMDLTGPEYKDPANLARPEVAFHVDAVLKKWVSSYTFDKDLWKEGQKRELHWAPIRKPEENMDDPHWKTRETFSQVYHEDLDETLTYIGAPWLAEHCPWRVEPRPPRLGEHSKALLNTELSFSDAEIEDLKSSGVI
ncbi:CoA transferase [Dehalococcoidia bacterium]|nr:CoA transferase [Dehalococcoidia bacterium]